MEGVEPVLDHLPQVIEATQHGEPFYVVKGRKTPRPCRPSG
jgi:hypothetical protein